jgi:hypothetical protein
VVLTIIILLSFVYKASSGELIEEKKIALNTGILIDTILSANGNTFLSTYIENNSLKITDNKVEVGEKWTQSFYTLENKDTQIISDSTTFKDMADIEIFKTGNKIYIGSDIKKIYSLSCPSVFIKKPSNVAILPKNEIRLETAIEQAFGSKLQIIKIDSLEEYAELVIMLNSTDGTPFKIEIPPNSLESRRLACVITNELLIENPDLRSEIVVVENELFEKSDTAVIITLTSELNNKIKTFISLSKALELTFT